MKLILNSGKIINKSENTLKKFEKKIEEIRENVWQNFKEHLGKTFKKFFNKT